jgi:hypothetical protein
MEHLVLQGKRTFRRSRLGYRFTGDGVHQSRVKVEQNSTAVFRQKTADFCGFLGLVAYK